MSIYDQRLLGRYLVQFGYYDRAVNCLNGVLKRAPEDAVARNALVHAWIGLERPSRAVAHLDILDGTSPLDAAGLHRLGHLRGQINDYSGAESAFRRLDQLAPNQPKTVYDLANQLLGQMKLDEAIKCYERAIELDGRIAQHWCNYGHALREAGRFADAVDAFAKGHELGMQDPQWRYPSAQWLVDAESLRDEWEQMDQWIQSPAEGDSAEQLLVRGTVALAKGQASQAYELFRAGFALEPDLRIMYRYDHGYLMACAAVMSAMTTTEANKTTRDEWLHRAIDILVQELANRQQTIARLPAFRDKLHNDLCKWLWDPRIASIRDKPHPDALRPDDRMRLEQFWDDVARLEEQLRNER